MKDELILVGVMIIAIALGTGIFLFGSFTNSEGSKPLEGSETALSAVAVPFTELAQGAKSNVTARVNYVITSLDELHKLWGMIGGSKPVPEVDFSKQEVLAIFAGQKGGGGYDIEVKDITDNADTRAVVLRLTEPDPNCENSTAITSPYEIVVVPNTSLPLAHKDEVETVGCPR